MPRGGSVARGLGFDHIDEGVVPGPWKGGTSSAQQVSKWPPGGAQLNTSHSDYGRNKSTEETSPTSVHHPSMLSPVDSINGGFFSDARRPSVASNATFNSMGTLESMTGQPRTNKKLHAFFGEDVVPSAEDARQLSNASLPTPTEEYDEHARPFSQRNTSFGNQINNSALTSRAVSPTRSSIMVPNVSSEVTPWMFQDAEVSQANATLCQSGYLDRSASQILGKLYRSLLLLRQPV